MRSFPYGMAGARSLALAAGERYLFNRMRVWFGGLSVSECEAILGREALTTPPDPSISSKSIELAAYIVFGSDILASPIICWSAAIE